MCSCPSVVYLRSVGASRFLGQLSPLDGTICSKHDIHTGRVPHIVEANLSSLVPKQPRGQSGGFTVGMTVGTVGMTVGSVGTVGSLSDYIFICRTTVGTVGLLSDYSCRNLLLSDQGSDGFNSRRRQTSLLRAPPDSESQTAVCALPDHCVPRWVGRRCGCGSEVH